MNKVCNEKTTIMNYNQFTVKSQEAIEKAFQIAQEKGHQSIDVSHLTKSLFVVADSVMNYLFGKLGINFKNTELLID